MINSSEEQKRPTVIKPIEYPRLMKYIGQDSCGEYVIMEFAKRNGIVVMSWSSEIENGHISNTFTTHNTDEWELYTGVIRLYNED